VFEPRRQSPLHLNPPLVFSFSGTNNKGKEEFEFSEGTGTADLLFCEEFF
jgi:hypothetical protein